MERKSIESQAREMKKLKENWKSIALICLTLGLAPFNPPHIWGKLKWIAGGAENMQLMDWFDTAMHGTPWILLIIIGIAKLKD